MGVHQLRHNKGISTLMALTLAGLLVTAVAVGALAYYALVIKGTGKIATIGLEIYADAGCTQGISTIDWGVVNAGSTKSIGIFVKLTGNVKSYLTMNATNFVPSSAANYLYVYWDLEYQALLPGEVRQGTITLAVAANTIGIVDFSFDMRFFATQVGAST